MLLLHPRVVTFGAVEFGGVESVSIDREGERIIEQWSDAGPHAVLVDVPEQRVRVKVVQALTSDDVTAPTPGEQGTLTFQTAANSSGAQRVEVSMTAVVVSLSYGVSRKGGSTRVIELVAVSADGSTDPVSVSAV